MNSHGFTEKTEINSLLEELASINRQLSKLDSMNTNLNAHASEMRDVRDRILRIEAQVHFSNETVSHIKSKMVDKITLKNTLEKFGMEEKRAHQIRRILDNAISSDGLKKQIKVWVVSGVISIIVVGACTVFWEGLRMQINLKQTVVEGSTDDKRIETP